MLHDSQLTAGATRTLRAPPDQEQRTAISVPAREEGFAKRLHTRGYYDRIIRPIARYAGQFPHQISAPLYLRDLFVFSVVGPVDSGSRSMQEEVSGKNHLGQHFVGLY